MQTENSRCGILEQNELSVKSNDGRQFSQTFSMNIEVNTSPPEITEIKIARTATVPAYYVVCCKIDNTGINNPVNGGRKLHEDIAAIRVTKENGAEESIPIRVNASGTDFDAPLPGGKRLPPTSVAHCFRAQKERVCSDISRTQVILPKRGKR